MDTDLNSAIYTFLSNCEDQQLLQLTRFYMERLEQSVEQGVEGVSFMLTYDHHFNEREYHRVTELVENGNRVGASKLLLNLVMEKGPVARRVMWESFVKLQHHSPKLSRILDEIGERGDGQFAYMDTERGFSEVPAHLQDLNSAISAFLSNCADHKLFRLTKFYMEGLEQAIEEGVEIVGFMLMGEDHFTGREYHRVTELAEKGNRAGASKLLLELVMEKDSGVQRVMWESFVKLHHRLPKMSRILKEIRERGDGQFAYMDTERGLSEVPAHLKESPICPDCRVAYYRYHSLQLPALLRNIRELPEFMYQLFGAHETVEIWWGYIACVYLPASQSIGVCIVEHGVLHHDWICLE